MGGRRRPAVGCWRCRPLPSQRGRRCVCPSRGGPGFRPPRRDPVAIRRPGAAALTIIRGYGAAAVELRAPESPSRRAARLVRWHSRHARGRDGCRTTRRESRLARPIRTSIGGVPSAGVEEAPRRPTLVRRQLRDRSRSIALNRRISHQGLGRAMVEYELQRLNDVGAVLSISRSLDCSRRGSARNIRGSVGRRGSLDEADDLWARDSPFHSSTLAPRIAASRAIAGRDDPATTRR